MIRAALLGVVTPSDAQGPPRQQFLTVPDLSLQRQFPEQFRRCIPIEFYPAPPERIVADLLEIGPGRGDFLLTRASQAANQSFVAIELGKKRYLKLIRRIQRLGLVNITLICGDARLIIPRYFPDSSVGTIVVLFPDPWPKRRHAFHRLLQPLFLRELARCLKVGGQLFLRSDVGEYVTWVAGHITTIPEFQVVEDRWPYGPVRSDGTSTLSLYADRQSGLGYRIHGLCLERM